MPKKSREPVAPLQAAIKMLARRAYTARELQDKLRRKDYSIEEIDETVQYCLDKTYIDESEIAEDHIRVGRDLKMKSRFLLRLELQKRGVNQELIESKLASDYTEAEEREVALKLGSKKLRTLEHDDHTVRYRKIGSALSRKGFPSEVIASTLRQLNLDD